MKTPYKSLVFFALILVFSCPAFAQSTIPEIAPAVEVGTYEQLLGAIREVRKATAVRIQTAMTQETVREAWEMGKLIDEHMLKHKERQDYGAFVAQRLASDLGMTRSEINHMVEFVRAYPVRIPEYGLTWGHYKALLAVNDAREREKLAAVAAQKKWTRPILLKEIKKLKLSWLPPPQLKDVKPGTLHTYRTAEFAGKKYYDLGFSTYFELKGDPKEQNVFISTDDADLYTYEAKVTKVFDGDTFHALVDLGFGVVLEQRLRLRQLDAPEIAEPDGQEAKAVLEKALRLKPSPVSSDAQLEIRDFTPIVIKVSKYDDPYGRYLVDVWVNGKPVNQTLLSSGLFSVREDS